MDSITSRHGPNPSHTGSSNIPAALIPFWLACHAHKKLAKKQILEADIQEAVDEIAVFTSVGF